MENLVLSINGMHCGSCVRRVTTALENVGGVKVEQVEIGTAKVQYDPQSVSPQQVAEAVNKIGFEARVS